MTCKTMGIVNVTPDSFSDGGRFFSPEEAVRRARNLVKEGAAIIDLGGESTRPGAVPISWEEEWGRLEPVFALLAAGGTDLPLISVDTYHPETAERAVAAGAKMINCVRTETAGAMLDIIRGRPDLELVIPSKLLETTDASKLPMPRIYLDPMIGFDTTREEDIRLLRSIPELARIGRVLIGVSRKRVIKKLVGEKATGKDLAGNLALAVWCAMNGAGVIRVHDVGETVRALKVVETMEAAE